MDRLIPLEEAAQMLGRTPMAVRKLVERRLVPFRKSRRRVFFIEQELQEYIDAMPGVSPKEARERAEAGV